MRSLAAALASRSRREGNEILREWCPEVTGRVLSVGSGTDLDKEGARYRDYFSAAESYETSDTLEGCDLLLDVRWMPEVPDESYDCVFAHSVLEHVDAFASALVEMWRVLRPGGVLLLGVPFMYKPHREPQDFWRFTEHGIRRMLGAVGMEVEDVIGVGGDPKCPEMYWARARK